MKFFVIATLEQHVFERLMILFDKKLLFLWKQSYLFEMLDDRGVYESFCGTPFLNKKIKQIWGESALCPLKINFTTCSLLLWFVKYTPYLCDRHQQSWLFSLRMFCFRKQEISYIKKFHVTLGAGTRSQIQARLSGMNTYYARTSNLASDFLYLEWSLVHTFAQLGWLRTESQADWTVLWI